MNTSTLRGALGFPLASRIWFGRLRERLRMRQALTQRRGTILSFGFYCSLVPSLELLKPVFQQLLYCFQQILLLRWSRSGLLVKVRKKGLDLFRLGLG